MSNISMKNITLTLFGESHGKCVGGVITGFPPGLKVSYDEIKKDMDRRKPGQSNLTTKRKESDDFEFLSGIYNDITTGAPICITIKNSEHHSNDYENIKNIPRPSHADYPAYVKYSGYNDVRGGGHFSGRLTAPVVCLGSLCKQFLKTKNISIYANIENIGGIKNTAKDGIDYKIQKLISDTAAKGDSVGGKILCLAKGIPAGYGGPLFEGIEGTLSKLFFGIPAVKAVEFGLGGGFADSFGSKVNDIYSIKDGEIRTLSNNNGGIAGGITNGNSIDALLTFKPTPSIYITQKSVDLKEMKEAELKIKGRHDPCIVLRAVPVAEAIMSIEIMDMVI